MTFALVAVLFIAVCAVVGLSRPRVPDVKFAAVMASIMVTLQFVLLMLR